ncbi:hypothetical protein GYH30_039939 [Glycine max]|nr:hypothetical protein GYH30_039939 [Glycine max]
MALQLTLALHLSSFISAVIVSLASTLTPTCGYCRSRWPPSWMSAGVCLNEMWNV